MKFEPGDSYFEINSSGNNKVREYIRDSDGVWHCCEAEYKASDGDVESVVKSQADFGQYWIGVVRDGDIIL